MKYIITEEKLNRISKLIIEMINKEGIVTASKFFGGYDSMKKLLGDYEIPKQAKIDTIKKFIDDESGYGIHLGEIDEEPIPYREDNNGYHQIEYLGYSKVIVNVWGGYKNQTDKGEYGVHYDNLPEKSLDDIIEMIINRS
jgi:hypothetical protein